MIDGTSHVLKLTLGALAELESELKTGTLMELVERFETGRFATSDLLALIVAGLRGGGWQGVTSDLLSAEIEGGLAGAASAAGALLARAFALPGET